MEDDLTYSDSSDDVKLDCNSSELRTQLLLDFYKMAHKEDWYDVLPYEGAQFVFFRNKGEQHNYGFVTQPTLNNVGTACWHFYIVTIDTIDALNDIKNQGIPMYVANFGCFLRGLEVLTPKKRKRRYKGWKTIKKIVGERRIFANHDDIKERIGLYERIKDDEAPMIADKIDEIIEELHELVYLREQSKYVENMCLMLPF